MAGTGNLLLKRGQTIPTDGALLRAMPAVQLIAPSPVVTNGTQAYVNYPNRLWVGMDNDPALVPNQNNCTTGTFSYSNAEPNSGTVGAIPGVQGPCNSTGATINNTRPIWMGAEIRAAVAVDDANNAGTPTILEADWVHPSDYILVTQKSIYEWAMGQFAKGSGGGTVKLFESSDPTSPNFIELRAPDSPVTSYDLIYPAALPPTSAVGKALTIQSVDGSNNATLTWSDPGAAASASTVAIGNTVTAGTYYIPYTDATSGNGALNVDTSTLTYNPDTNTLTTSKVALNGSTSGTTTIQASATAGSTTITLPATTGTVVTTGDSGTVTSAMIADGTIVNGDISTTAAISVSKLSASTISGVTLGNNLNALTISTGLSGTSYNGSGAVTIAIDNTVATLTGLQNLTNKTLGAGSIWNGNLIGLQYGGTNKNFAASPPTTGSLVYFDADSMEALTPGSAGTVLYIGKGSGVPTWTAAADLDVASAQTASAINSILDTTTTNTTYYPLFALNSIISQNLRIDSSTLTYNPSTNTLTTGNLTASSAVSASTLSTTGNGTIGGDLTVTGNLTVNGTTTTVNTETVTINDNIIVLNNNEAGTPTQNAGLEVERGTSPNTSFLWNETTDRWSVNHTDTTQSAYEYPITISDSSSDVHSGPAEGGYSTTGNFVGQGSISGTTLSITTVSSGAIRIGQIITGTGIASGTKITAWSSGSATGGTSSWTVNNSQTVSSTTITGSAGAAGPQYIHSAYIKYLDVKNLNMSGSWILGATISSNFDLQNGGLLLPYVGGSYHSTNALSGLPEGQIAYNTSTNRIVFNQGGTAGVDNSGTSQVSVISTGNLSDITSVGTLGNTSISGTLSVTNTTDSTNSTSGSVILSGGVGIAKKLYVGTDLNVTSNTSLGGTLGVTGVSTFSDATDSSSSTTGSAKFAGGVGIAKKLYVGTDLNVTQVSNLNGGIAVNTNAFTVATSTGNVSMTGSFTSTNATDSSSSTTGSFVLSGGIGIAKNLNVAGNVGITGTTTLGNALALNYTNPSITTNQTSGTIALLNTAFTGTGNVLGQAQIINIGTNQTSGATINIGTQNNTTLTSNGALTVTGTLTANGALTANGNVALGSDTADTIAFNGVITSSLKFGGSASDTTLTTLSAESTSANVAVTLPNWAGRAVVMSTTETSGYLITSGGNNQQPSWTDPDNVVVGGVFVRRETTQTTTKYPIPFLGSSKQNDPGTSWGSLTSDGASQASYLYTDMTSSGGSVSSTVTNSSSGLMYEVGNGVGTLYADYIGATLDCGTY